MHQRLALLLLTLLVPGPAVFATLDGEEADMAEAAPPPAAERSFLVVLPERIDVEWYWYHYTAESQHIVQSAVEQALIRNKFPVKEAARSPRIQEINSIDQLLNAAEGIKLAESVNADHLITGSAVAVWAGQNIAYGVAVHRASVEVTAKIVRVSDGKVMAVEQASATEGAQSQRMAAQKALKTAGDAIARKLVRAIHQLDTSE
jgi:hypothetical protein